MVTGFTVQSLSLVGFQVLGFENPLIFSRGEGDLSCSSMEGGIHVLAMVKFLEAKQVVEAFLPNTSIFLNSFLEAREGDGNLLGSLDEGEHIKEESGDESPPSPAKDASGSAFKPKKSKVLKCKRPYYIQP